MPSSDFLWRRSPRRVSRRIFLEHLAALGGSAAFLHPPFHFPPQPDALPMFEEIPAAKSGIHFVHTAG
jgi:hypothetical protein